MSNSECPWLFTWPFKFISAADKGILPILNQRLRTVWCSRPAHERKRGPQHEPGKHRQLIAAEKEKRNQLNDLMTFNATQTSTGWKSTPLCHPHSLPSPASPSAASPAHAAEPQRQRRRQDSRCRRNEGKKAVDGIYGYTVTALKSLEWDYNIL